MRLSEFVIDMVFRSEKNWGSFDASEWGSADDGDADMRTATHDAVLCEDCDLEDRDYGHILFINWN